VIGLGSSYPAAIDVLDDTGQPANPDTATLTIIQPDGTVATPTITLPPAVEGQLRLAWPTAMPGRHVVRWVTSNPDTTYRDVFDVGEDLPPSIVSLADAKQHLNIDPADTSDDDELLAWIAGVTRAVEMAKNEIIVKRQITSRQTVRPGDKLRLWELPVISLDSITAVGCDQTWDAANFDVDPDTGIVDRLAGLPVHGRVVTVHTAGYQVISYNVQQASLVLLAHVWEGQRGPGTIGEGVVGPEEASDYKMMSLMPRKVREWLGPPRPVIA
jgi:hypothetical protein